ncbi:MAG: chromate transporter [Lachnospiraceae bacterium]|nr:chromate transporter [Lachnospiraceae bacterium]
MIIYLKLFWEFFKAGLFAIGGGMATVPFLQEISRKTGWYTAGDLADMIAVSESTPGPIGVNMATYVGYTTVSRLFGPVAGILGGILSTVGLVMPSVIIILIVARFLEKFRENRYVNAAMYGLRAASVALISSAGISIVLIAVFQVNTIEEWRSATIDYRCFVLAAVILILTRWVPKVKDLHPICFIIASAVIGIIFHMSVPL